MIYAVECVHCQEILLMTPQIGNAEARIVADHLETRHPAVLGAAAILRRSVTEAARDALAWVLARDGKGRQPKQYFGRTSR